jgi:hypothetical protein
MQLGAGKCRHIQEDYIKEDRAGYDDSESCQHRSDMRGERGPERLLLACAPPRCEKGPGFIETTADIEFR